MTVNRTKQAAEKLAEHYIERDKKGEFKSYKHLHQTLLDNVVNSEYGRTSNEFIEYFWQHINKYFE